MKKLLALPATLAGALIVLAFGATAAQAQKALVYCPTDESAGCATVATALTAAYPGGVDKAYDGTSGTVDLRTVDLYSYSVFFVPSLSDDAEGTPLAFLRDLTVSAKLRNALLGRRVFYAGTPDFGTENRDKKNALIVNLARWAGANHATVQGPGFVALQDNSENEPAQYNWAMALTGLNITTDWMPASYATVRTLTPTGAALLSTNGAQLAYANMASYGFYFPNGAPGISMDAVGQTGTSVGGNVVLVTAEGANTGGAWVKTDKNDYAPGTTVVMSGGGFQAGETITITLHEDPLVHTDRTFTATADAQGNFTFTGFAPEPHDMDVRFVLTAVGQASGRRAQTTFTDGSVERATVAIKDVTTGASPSCGVVLTSTFAAASSVCADVTVTVGGNGEGGNFRLQWYKGTDVAPTRDIAFADVATGFNTKDIYAPTSGTWVVKVCKTVNPGACSSGNIVGTSPTFTVSGISTTGLTVASASGTYGGTATLSATMTTGSSPVANKTLHFKLNGGASVGTATTNASGVATLSNVSLAGIDAGTYASGVTATFAGDASYSTSSATGSLQIARAGQSIAFLPLDSKKVGDAPFALSATATSNLTVGFSSTTTAVCGVTGTSVSIIAAGTCTIVASQPGNTNYAAAVDFQQSFQVTKATPVVTWNNPTGIVYGAALTGTQLNATATINGTTVPGTYAYSPAAGVVLGAGPAQTLLVTFTPTDATNYNTESKSVTIDVSKASLTVAADDKSRAYGSDNPTLSGSLTGVVSGDNITATYATAATPASAVGTYPITATLVDPSAKLTNYIVTPTSGTLTITAAPLSVTADSKTKVYGDANPTLTGTVTGIKNGDAITGSYSTTATQLTGVGSAAITAGVTATAAVLANYGTPTATSGTLTITAAPLSVTADSKTKVYGDANPTLTGTVTGIKNGDAITGSYSTTATQLTGVGSAAITAGVTATAAVLANYGTPTATSGTLTITAAPLSVTADSKTKVYGDANPTLTGTVTGIKNGDAITGSYSTTATQLTGVGSAAITAGVTATAAVLANYGTPTATSGTLTITAAPLSVTADSKTKVYGDANPTLTGTVTGIKNGDAITGSYSTTATQLTGVGSAAITAGVTATAAVLANYGTPTATSGTLTITAAPLSVTADSKTKVYGDANPTLTGTVTGIKNGDAITGSYSTTATQLTGVGSAAITAGVTATAAVLANYGTPTATSGTLTITAAPLSVTADSKTKVYGDANPTLTGTVTGIKNGDAITGSYSTTATQLTGVGSAAITAGVTATAAVLANYGTPTATSGTLTITAAPLSVTADSKTKVYGDANPTLTGTVTGIKNGDAITGSYSTTATQLTGVGSAAITAGVTATAAVLANYGTPTATSGTLTITAAPLSVTADSKTKVYGDANPTLTGTVTGIKNGDAITGSYSTTATQLTGVGSAAITAGVTATAAVLANYGTPTATSGTLTITAAPLSVTADSKTKVYGDANPTLTGTVTGIKNGDAITGSYSTTATQLTGVGSAAITAGVTATAAVLANYGTPTATSGTLTITAAPLSMVVANATKVYNTANPTLTGTLSGIKNNDAIIVQYSTTAVLGSNVGTYPITAALSPADKLANYVVSNTPGALTITQATVKVTSFTNLVVPFSASATQKPTAITDPSGVSYNLAFYQNDLPVASTGVTQVGVYQVVATTTDPNYFVATGEALFVIYDPAGGFVTGGGWIDSPATACRVASICVDASGSSLGVIGKANFGFVSKYQAGADKTITLTGNTEFQFKAGNINFKSTSYEWLTVAGARAQYKGRGTINGAGDYGFMLTAIDGDVNGGRGEDRFRIKIWIASNDTNIVYDNQIGAGDDDALTAGGTLLGGGSISIKK